MVRMLIRVFRDGVWEDWPTPLGWTLSMSINAAPRLTSPVGKQMPAPWAVLYDGRLVANSVGYLEFAGLQAAVNTERAVLGPEATR